MWKFLRNIRMSNSEQLEERLPQCNQSLDEFHAQLVDLTTECYQKPLYELSEEQKSQLALYELRAIQACLNLHHIPSKYHERYMINRLMMGGYSESVSIGMVAGFSTIKNQPVCKYDDGETGYKAWLLMGQDDFIKLFSDSLKSWAKQEMF